MKINCKCGHRLTSTSLRPTKYWKRDLVQYSDGQDGEPEIFDHNREIRSGTFIYLKEYKWYCDYDGRSMLLIAKEDFTDQDQVNDYYGRGCCGLNCWPVTCSACKTEIGIAFLDCYDWRHIGLDTNKVTRQYKDL